MSPCLTPEQFQRLLAEQLSESERWSLEAHVDACPHCEEKLTRLLDDSEEDSRGVDWRRLRRTAPEIAPEPEADLLQRLRESVPRQAAAAQADIPPYLGRYRITARIGSGAFGIVYRAYDDDLRRDVAIKVPHRHRIRSPQDIETYLAEARILASLTHPGIVTVYDVGRTEDGLCYLVSGLVAGSDLKTRIRQTRLAHAEAAEIVARVAEALHHAHQRGLVHRDIKPANILLDGDGQPLVADFGLALREEDFGTGPDFVGTPAYMSPEQARGEGHLVDARTDVFSLGVVFYELLTGRRPFRSDTKPEMVNQIKTLEARPPRQLDVAVPKELDRICLKALSKRASDRYSTALDLAEDLRHWQAGLADKAAVNVHRIVSPPAGTTPSSLVTRGVLPDSDQRPIRVVAKGLRSFDAGDADFFLELLPGPRNRDGLPDSLRFWKTRLEATDPDVTFRVGLLYGPSGCGKSSLVKAGLLPRLADHVLPVYLEATPEDTATRLLHGLRKRCPSLSEGLHLVEALAVLRRGRALPAAKKIVLVLDQFEQWLHAHQDDANAVLIQALRQCDGQHVQCLLLVRDDFWMATTRFMRHLEIRLVEGANSTAVDLFELRHARKVLEAFGRAFGALPEGPTSPEQEPFLEEALAGLAQEGKIIPVRLSLFAEMIKGKPWTPATLREVGGTEGIGVTFLEGTFSSTTAPPEHRLHQRAARAVLRTLLPEHGTDLKAVRRTVKDLLQASGYVHRSADFEALLHILDAELRLVTPTDPECVPVADWEDEGRAASVAAPGERYYQLTHDYLVPALRQWLTRKQRETRRGRMQLLLAERAALWGAKQESRQLPGWWEWMNLLFYTRDKDWTVLESRMLRTATRRYLRQAGMLLLFLGAIAWVSVEVYRGPLRAMTLVRELRSAEISRVPQIVEELSSCRRWANPRLEEMVEESPPGSNQELYARLALLPVHPEGQKRFLYERMLEADTDEFMLICEALRSHSRELLPMLWDLLKIETNPDRRFRAVYALLSYDPSDPRCEHLGSVVADNIVKEDPVHAAKGSLNYILARDLLGPHLHRILKDRDRPVSERVLAARLYPTNLLDTPSVQRILIDLLLDTEGKFYSEFLPWFTTVEPKAAAELLRTELDKRLRPDATEEDVKRLAHAAVVLLQLDRAEGFDWPLPHGGDIWPLLHQSPDPRLRSYFIRRLSRVNLDPKALIQQYLHEQDVGVKRALLLSLGDFTEIQVPAQRPQPLVEELLKAYRDDPDRGLHAAVDWLLRQRWGLAWIPTGAKVNSFS